MKAGGIVHKVKRVFNRRGLDSLILFVTNACNLACNFCCYAGNLNRSRDISLEDMERISRSMGHFRALLVSGGEPFIRDDLDRILLAFCRNNAVSSIYIPTNGWFLEKTAEICKSFLEQEREAMLTLSFSVDGLAATHDRMRGREGTFENLCKTIACLSPWRSDHPNLRLRVNSVVTPGNVGEMGACIDYFHKKFDLDEHALEIVRDASHVGAHHDSPERRDIIGTYLDLVNHACDMYTSDGVSRRGPLGNMPGGMGQLFACAYNQCISEIKRDRVMGRLWPFPCTAGCKILVISGSGSLRACELRGEVVDLRGYGFDVGKALETGLMQKECDQIYRDRCDCIHGCFVGNSLQHSPKAVLGRFLPKVLGLAARRLWRLLCG